MCASCFAVTDLDRFEAAPTSTSKFFDLSFTVRGMDSHVAETLEVRITDRDKIIQTRVFVKPLGGSAKLITIPAAIPKQDTGLVLQFFADHNNTGVYDLSPQPRDHSWRLNVDDFKPKDPGEAAMVISFDHTPTFQDLDPVQVFGNDAIIKLSNLGGYQGKRLQVRIADANSTQTVGLYRVSKVETPSIDARLEGMIDKGVGTRYLVQVSADSGSDDISTAEKAAAKTASLEGYELEAASGPSGLTVDFDPTRDQGKRLQSPSGSGVVLP
jgi:hypothetical protein